jgi:hypothetical protein
VDKSKLVIALEESLTDLAHENARLKRRLFCSKTERFQISVQSGSSGSARPARDELSKSWVRVFKCANDTERLGAKWASRYLIRLQHLAKYLGFACPRKTVRIYKSVACSGLIDDTVQANTDLMSLATAPAADTQSGYNTVIGARIGPT